MTYVHVYAVITFWLHKIGHIVWIRAEWYYFRSLICTLGDIIHKKSDKIMWVIYWSCISQFICFQKIHVPMLLPFFFSVSYLLLELNPAGVNVNERGRWVMWMKVEGMLFPYTAASWDYFFHAQIKLVSVTLAVKLTNLEPPK